MGAARIFQRTTELMVDLLARVGARYWLKRWPVPLAHELLTDVPCRGPLHIVIDRSGVPHIHGQENTDVFFGQGYCHARDRLWQMELSRRIARGELAELFGERFLGLDRLMRRLGFRQAAEAELATLGPSTREAIEAYAAGATTYIERHRRPLEFMVLQHLPAAWSPIDSLAFARYMGWMMTANAETELVRARLAQAIGPERAAALEQRPPYSSAAMVDGLPLGTGAAPLGDIGGASNNWAVSAARSATGRPLLANDPHMRPRMPGTWYVVHLKGGDYDVIGASLPGAVGVLAGHNTQAAWGITASSIDGQDLFIEEAEPGKPDRFRGPNGWYDGHVHTEEIFVRGRRQPVVERIVRTRHGPLLNGALDLPTSGTLLALADIVADASSPTEALLDLNRATDWPTFRAALARWTYPTLNFVYADTAGTIAWKMAGRVPVRAAGDGSMPVSGADGVHDWTGWVPFDDLPEVVNPTEGQVFTANSRPSVAPRAFLARDWMDDGRHRRIAELLAARPTLRPSDFMAMQLDVLSLPGREIAHALAAAEAQLPDLSSANRELLALLAHWDGQLTVESVPASLYHVFRRELLERVAAELPPALRGHVHGQGIHEALSCDSVFHVRGTSLLQAHLTALLATDAGRRTVAEAWAATTAWLQAQYGPERRDWAWGNLHAIRFEHVLGRGLPWLDRLAQLSRGPVPLGGDQDTIAQAGVDPWRPFQAATFIVSYRQVVDVGEWDAAQFILPTGQSGHPGSRYYDDMVEPWSRGEYRPLWFSPTAIAAASAETIGLWPRAPGPERGREP